MPSISSILSVATQALAASQNGINVTAHNIANASTEGYTRQRPVIQANTPAYFPYGALGTGASLVNVERVRDAYIDGTFRRESRGAAYAESRNNILSRIETVLNEPGEQSLSANLDAFFNIWSEFATNPGDTTVQNLVRRTGAQVAQGFKDLTTQLDLVRQEGESRLSQYVNRVNALSEEISNLNREVVTVEAGGITATELRDARDRALDELAQLADVQVSERGDGSVGVSLQGYMIADRDAFNSIEMRYSAGTLGIGIVGRTGFVPSVGGRVGGMLTALNDDLGAARTQLDAMAESLVTDVNALHATGTSSNGATGIDFFDPAGVTASSMALSADILANLDNLAAGTADGSGAYRAGANDVALAIAGYRENDSPTLGQTFAAGYRGLVSDVGMALRSSTDAGQVAQTLADNAAMRRESLSGVNTDEELVSLIRYQTAYSAAARIITTADEMLQTILSI